MARRIFAAVLLSSLACGESVTWVAPPVQDAASAILVTRRSAGAEVWAVDLENASSALEPSGLESIEGMFLREALSELDLLPGQIQALSDGVPLPQNTNYSLSFRDGDAAAWSEIQPVAELQDKLRPHPDKCVGFEQIWNQPLVGSVGDAHALLRLGPDRFVVTTLNGQVYLLEGTEVTQVQVQDDLQLGAMAQAPDGSFRFGGFTGELYRADFDLSLGRITIASSTQAPSQVRVLAMAVESTAEGAVVTVDTNGKVQRWNGSSWQMIFDYGVILDSTTTMLKDDNGDIWLAGDNAIDVLRIREGIVETIQPPALNNGVPGLALIPDFGITILSSAGDVFHRVGEDWVFLEGSPIRLNMAAVHRFRTGFLYGGVFGLVGQYRQPNDYCEEFRWGQGTIKHITELGDDLLLVTDGGDNTPPAIERVRPVTP